MTMITESSKVYDKTRDELVQYEDAEFFLLMSHVPNYYITRNDTTYWGNFLRNVASELGRMEYFHAYDIVSKDPSYLNPDDARRIWNDPLFINRNYPSDTDYDQDYKTLVLNLLAAYQQGATTKAIYDVIVAYMGSDKDIQVTELFKLINNPPYDASYRNTITALVPVITLGSSNSQTLANNLYTLSHDLYRATDLAKPAHVGLQLGLVLGGLEDTFRAIIDEAETTTTVNDTTQEDANNYALGSVVWDKKTLNLKQTVGTMGDLSWQTIYRLVGAYITADKLMYQFNGYTWEPVVETDTDILRTNNHYYWDPSTNAWILGTQNLNPTPRFSAGLRFIVANEESPLPTPLYEAPFKNVLTPETGLASSSTIYANPVYGVSGSDISIFGTEFKAGAVIVTFTGTAGSIPAAAPVYLAPALSPGISYQIVFIGTTDFTLIGATSNTVGEIFTATGPSVGTGTATPTSIVVSDSQLIVSVPIGAISGPIQVTVGAGTSSTALDFLVQTTPVYYSRPGVLSPLLNKAWEIKSDSMDILSLD